ncbi:hypothetical protein GGF32_002195 [Allomyces javanicus]|nr:hypothetical protein GGF32_002195 [Allomyces javanicus]
MSFSLTRLVKNVLQVGPKDAWHQLLILGEVKAGTLIGTDQFGNRYYENREELFARERWVVPASKKFDPSEIPAGWHTWIHRIDARAPHEVTDIPNDLKWMAPHTRNGSGSEANYKSYSTTEPKIEAWTPKAANRG